MTCRTILDGENRTNRQQRMTAGRQKAVVSRNRLTAAANENGRGDTERYRRRPLNVGYDRLGHHRSETGRGRRVRGHTTTAKAESAVTIAVVAIAAKERAVVAKPQPRSRKSKRKTAGQRKSYNITETVMKDLLNDIKNQFMLFMNSRWVYRL